MDAILFSGLVVLFLGSLMGVYHLGRYLMPDLSEMGQLALLVVAAAALMLGACYLVLGVAVWSHHTHVVFNKSDQNLIGWAAVVCEAMGMYIMAAAFGARSGTRLA